MKSTDLDRRRLNEALSFAQEAIGLSDPNPRVGCVIGSEQGQVFGHGHTQQAGGPHAEVMALRDAQAAGAELRGATAWVTLEPCAHHGRTPPCCDALVQAGLARVVVAVADPYAQVNGAGIARLRAAGITVDMADDDIAAAARDINIGFFSRVERGRPWVRLKAAVSLDGRMALPDGRSQWITGPAARADGHAWRRRAGAVLTGVGTVKADDPRLDVRLVPTMLQPLRVVVDSRLQLPTSARLLAPPGQVLVATTVDDPVRSAALRAAGADIEHLPALDGRVDLRALIDRLGQRGINELHVEAGPTLNGALLSQGLVDEVLVYQAPMLIGAGLPLADMAPPSTLADALRYAHVELVRLAPDWRVRLRHGTFGFPPCRGT